MSYFHRSVTSNLGNLLTWRQLSIWIENGRNIARNNCLQVSKLPKLEVTDLWKYDIIVDDSYQKMKRSLDEKDTHKRAHRKDVLTLTEVFISQKWVNICEHIVKMGQSSDWQRPQCVSKHLIFNVLFYVCLSFRDLLTFW